MIVVWVGALAMVSYDGVIAWDDDAIGFTDDPFADFGRLSNPMMVHPGILTVR